MLFHPMPIKKLEKMPTKKFRILLFIIIHIKKQ